MQQKKWSGWFRNQSIRTKIVGIYVPIMVLPLIFFAYFACSTFAQEIIQRETSASIEMSKLIVTRIEGMMSTTQSAADIVMMDINRIEKERIAQLFDPAEEDLTDMIILRTRIQNQLSYAMIAFPDIDSIYFVDKTGEEYSPNTVRASMQPKEEENKAWGDRYESQLYKTTFDSRGENIWHPVSKRNYWVDAWNMPVLTLSKRINYIEDGHFLGTLYINIREDQLRSIYTGLSDAQDTSYYIVDDQGQISSSSVGQTLLTSASEMPFSTLLDGQRRTMAEYNGNTNTLTALTPFKSLKWVLVSEAPLHKLSQDIQKVVLSVVAMALVCLLIGFAGAGVLSRLIANPILALTRTMRHTRQGKLDGYVQEQGTDEIGQLAHGYNAMMRRIEGLVDQVEREQKRKRELSFALIQSQIKPHFLYNTLDLIYIMTKSGEAQKGALATKSLANFYRSTLSGGREIITLREEMDIVSNYLKIQFMRYSDVFEYTMDIAPSVQHCPILKLTIQPLVENAIYHGLKEHDRKGTISIKAYSSGSNLLVTVADDGAGIQQEKLAGLLHDGDAQAVGDSFGLRSVDERIKLHFGEEYGIFINSTQGRGTIVTLVLPFGDGGIKTC